MSSSVAPSAPASSSRIDEQLRLRIAEDLSGTFKGDIIGPDHADYERARLVWNAMIDRRPGLILRCTSTSDVVAAVNVAREHGLPPSIRCGGHNVAGKAMSDGGLTIDLSGLREVTVDPERKLVHVGGGCRLGDVDAATAPHAADRPGRDHVRDRRGWPGAGRRHRLVLPQARPDLRQLRLSGSSSWPAAR